MARHEQPTGRFNADGTLDIEAGTVAIRGAWPAIDGVTIRPLKVRVAGQTAEYTLQNGSMVLKLKRADGHLRLSATIRGTGRAPHWFQPLGNGRVFGVTRFFRHGLGFAGPSGFAPILNQQNCWSLDSYLSAAIVAADGATISVGATDHQQFLQKTTLFNRLRRGEFENRKIEEDAAFIECGFSTEQIEIHDGELHLPDLYFFAAGKPLHAMTRLAGHIAKANKTRTHQPPCYHYCSWYQRTSHYNAGDLDALIGFLKQARPQVPIQTIQIDDGYEPKMGDWLLPTPAKWPGGIAAAMAKIQAHGYRAGIWVGPFMVANRSRLYADHPDWVLHDNQGKPIAKWKRYHDGFECEETFILDTSHPDAMDYLTSVFRAFRQMGVRFFKTDFMDWGLADSTQVRRHTPGKTSVQYLVDVLRMIRREIGEDSYWLACIAPFAPFLGLADGMRLANDVTASWPSTHNMFRESFADQYFNNVYWQNDPDVLHLRDFYTDLSENQAIALARWNGILGGSINTSDDFARISPARLAHWRFLQPDKQASNAQLPYWDQDRRLMVAVRHYPRTGGWGVLFVNRHDQDFPEHCTMADLVGIPAANVFAWDHDGSHWHGRHDELAVEVPAGSSKLFYIHPAKKAPPRELTLAGGWQAKR